MVDEGTRACVPCRAMPHRLPPEWLAGHLRGVIPAGERWCVVFTSGLLPIEIMRSTLEDVT